MHKHNECDCGAFACEGCRVTCPGCGEWCCRYCRIGTRDDCYVCEEEDYCDECLEGCYCHDCFVACQLAVAWCCKNAQKTHHVLLEDVVERLVVIPRDDGERGGKRRRRDSE